MTTNEAGTQPCKTTPEAQDAAAAWQVEPADLSQPAPETEESKLPRAEIMDENHEAWNRRIDELMANGAQIVALRGAGSVNGIDPTSHDALERELHAQISILLHPEGSQVAVIFDGDPDDRDNPDVGSLFGRLADAYKGDERVDFLAAQKQGWYYPLEEGATLASANGTPYETYVFPDKEDGISGGHSELTQSGKLANYPSFTVVFAGPVGDIASEQLVDLNNKVESGRQARVVIIPAKVNGTLDAKDSARREAAEATGDNTELEKANKRLGQRHDYPFGRFADSSGRAIPELRDGTTYPNLKITTLLA